MEIRDELPRENYTTLRVASANGPHERPGCSFIEARCTRRPLTVKENFMSETIPASAAAESRMVSVPGGRLHVRDFPGAEPALVVCMVSLMIRAFTIGLLRF